MKRSTGVAFIKTRNYLIYFTNVNKIIVSKREPYGKKRSFKYFIGYDDHDYFGPSCIKLPQMIGYVNALIVIKQCLSRLLIKIY